MNNNFHRAIKRNYEIFRDNALEDNMRRKQEVYEKVPRIEEIDHSIQLLGIKYNKLVLMGADLFSKDTEQVLTSIDSLKLEKNTLLAEAGYPSDYMAIAYKCSLCKDTGYVDIGSSTERCVCHKQMLIDMLYSNSNLKLSPNDNFSCFDETLYSNVKNEERYKINIPPRDNILIIKQKCLDFVENFNKPDVKNLFFCGPAGTGKTFLSNCIGLELLKRGKTVLYQTAPRLFDVMNEYKLKAAREADIQDSIYAEIFDVDLLIIDDLGTESPSAARFSELLNILTTRQFNNNVRPCKTMISTNMGVTELYQYYDERIGSRIVGNFEMLRFAGDDIRRIKKVGGF